MTRAPIVRIHLLLRRGCLGKEWEAKIFSLKVSSTLHGPRATSLMALGALLDHERHSVGAVREWLASKSKSESEREGDIRPFLAG
ncbi:hypothetical protein VNO77_03291 [Canavalia gladiata]|uniref:Uncharacterized protein n=1 Tax=Canavalia gladiata TaxID=3824 RepID=A0AAN9MZE9_CANGL